ncbi:hypothetical protein BKA65DRAFT_554237 [Rhexocercosporidium sp. MPI-PUGE-AT-0058]|nr:hypothetical protein BKA65DRAFT_554237 [Rhexocercosporidium sp. MPI-PUGE-AT-0058]
MPPGLGPDKSIVLTSTAGDKSTWRPREYIPPNEVWDTVTGARILNTDSTELLSPKEENKQKKKEAQRWWRKKPLDIAMTKRKGMKVLETGVDPFPTHKYTLLERVNDFWRPVLPSGSSPKPRSPRIGFPSLVLKDKSTAQVRAAAVGPAFSDPSKPHNARVCMSKALNEDVRHDKDTCQSPPSSSNATSLLELGTQLGGEPLNPLAGPSMQRARFVHERAKDLISVSEVPFPAPPSKKQSKPKTKTKREDKVKVRKERKTTGWRWFSCCTKSKDECDCDNQEQGNLGSAAGETLINMSSEESLVNITFADSPILRPVLFRIADEHETTEMEHEHQHLKTFENTETTNSREDNMARRKIEVKKPELSVTTAPAQVASPVPAPLLAPSQPRDRESELSLAQRLKAMKEKHGVADNSRAHTEEGIWGGERRVQGPGGILRGEREAEDGFVEVDIPASNIKETKTLPGVASGSRVRYLGLALQDAIETPLPKPTEEEIARSFGGVHVSAASSGGQSFNTKRPNPVSLDGPATYNAGRTGQKSRSPTLSSGRTRSAPLTQPTFSTSASTSQPSQNSNDTTGPSRSLPTQIKRQSKAHDMNESFFKVRLQDHTDTGYPALDSSATSSDFGFKPALLTMHGSWPDNDSEWMEDKDEFEAALREKADSSKSVKKR